MGEVTNIKRTLSASEVKKKAEKEVREEILEKFKTDYVKLLKRKEDALLIVRNIEREMELLEEEIGE